MTFLGVVFRCDGITAPDDPCDAEIGIPVDCALGAFARRGWKSCGDRQFCPRHAEQAPR